MHNISADVITVVGKVGMLTGKEEHFFLFLYQSGPDASDMAWFCDEGLKRFVPDRLYDVTRLRHNILSGINSLFLCM